MPKKKKDQDKKYYKGIEFRIYPNTTQRNQINMTFSHCRFIWNKMLAMQSERHKNGGNYVSKYNMSLLLKPLKKEHPWLKDSESTALQNVCFNLDSAFQKLFHKNSKYPRFKSRSVYAQSYTSNFVNGNIKIKDNHSIKLPKLGWMRFKSGIECTDRIMAATVKRNSSGQYFVVLRVEFNLDKDMSDKDKKTIGIDLGVSDLLILSDGTKYETIKHEDKYEHELYIWQRKLARRRISAKKRAAIEEHRLKKQSRVEEAPNWWDYPNYRKAKIKVAKLKTKIANARKNRLHEITTELVRKYDIIKIEDLATKNMLKNHHLAKAISNQSWRALRSMLEYKCNWAGKKLQVVNPRKTSQICSNCGFDDGHHNLNIRTWTCQECSTILDRDINAAKNIMLATPKE